MSTTAAVQLARLRVQFPGWRIIRTRCGTLIACNRATGRHISAHGLAQLEASLLERAGTGGEMLDSVGLDRGAFACALSRGDEPRLFVVTQTGRPRPPQPSGKVVALPAAPGARRP